MTSTQPLPGTGQLVDQVFEMKRTLGQFARLIEISLNLNTTLDREYILQSIIETASDILECEAVSILLYNQASEELYFAASTDSQSQKLSGAIVPINNSIAGTIFTLNAPQIINDLSTTPLHYEVIEKKLQKKNHSLIGVPMRLHDQVIGVIEGINKRDAVFSMEDIDILSVIASQAAVAINNARMMTSLKEAYEELSRIDKIKSNFIAIASHELRTPLFHILGYAQSMALEAEGEDVEKLDQIIKSAKVLQSLVADITNMNLLETRSFDVRKEKVAAQKILVDAYKEIKPQLEPKKLKTAFNLPKPPLYILVDVEKISQAIVNVYQNAVHFSKEGDTIEIRLGLENTSAHISIRDHGVGIPPKELENIFDRFNQLEDHLTRTHSGLGLGLPIARGIIDLHQGRIWAESQGKNTGTTIHIILPLETTPPFILD